MISPPDAKSNPVPNTPNTLEKPEPNSAGKSKDFQPSPAPEEKNSKLRTAEAPSKKLAQASSNEINNNSPESPNKPTAPEKPDSGNSGESPEILKERERIEQERERIQAERNPDTGETPEILAQRESDKLKNAQNQFIGDFTNSPTNPDQPKRHIDSNINALNDVYSFSNNAGFEDFRVRDEYRKTLETLYNESPTFKEQIDKLQSAGKEITLVRKDDLEALSLNPDGSRTETEVGAVRIGFGDYKTSTINLLDHKNANPNLASFFYDTTEKGASLSKLSLARTLVHESMHASTGLNDNDIQNDYIAELKKLETGKDMIARYSNFIDPKDADGTAKSQQQIESEAIQLFAPGPIVRLTNQILSESETHREQPRIMYGAFDVKDKDEIPAINYFGNDLLKLMAEDFNSDGDYDLF